MMEYLPGVPQNTKTLRSCSVNGAKIVTPNITRSSDSFSTVCYYNVCSMCYYKNVCCYNIVSVITEFSSDFRVIIPSSSTFLSATHFDRNLVTMTARSSAGLECLLYVILLMDCRSRVSAVCYSPDGLEYSLIYRSCRTVRECICAIRITVTTYMSHYARCTVPS